MISKEIADFENALGVYSFGFQQEFIQYLETLKQRGYEVADVYNYVEAKKKVLKKESAEAAKDDTLIQPCSECPGIMFLLPVNDKPENQTGDPTDKSVWICQNNRCMHTIYNKETIEEIIKAGGT